MHNGKILLNILMFTSATSLLPAQCLGANTIDESIVIDKIYQNNLLDNLNKNSSDNKYFKFLKLKHLTTELKKNYPYPEKFLELQKNLIYNRSNLISLENLNEIIGHENIKIINETNSDILVKIEIKNKSSFCKENVTMNEKGLPSQNSSYATKPDAKKTLLKISNLIPRVLNIASGSNPDKKLYAVNIDLATVGEPEFVCNASDLSIFQDSYFTIVRASHILEHFKPEEIENTLIEWTRVLHENGELHIAVPDARIVIDELESGYVNGSTKPSIDFFHTTATIAQLYGVGYEDEKTDPRWRHHIIFNYELLCWYLKKIGMEVVEIMPAENDLAGACGIKDDSQNHYSLIVRARKTQKPHEAHKPTTDVEYAKILQIFTTSNSQNELPPLSVIIPVRNEEATIEVFLENLLKADVYINNLFKREYIIVCNATTDRSVEKINKFIKHSPNLNLKIIYSEPGILNAFHTGICARSLNGFVSKLDADCIIQNFTISLMYMNLCKNKDIQVTYAEPIPVGMENEFNYLQYHQWLRTKRLYIHGRCSMYRTNPFDLFNFDLIKKSGCRVEDIILSYCYAFYYGLSSIKCTDNAIIYSTPVDNKHDFEKKILRVKQEINMIESNFPYFIPMRSVLDRKLLCKNKQTLEQKNIVSMLNLYETLKNTIPLEKNNEEWYRLESTKKLIITANF